MPLPRRLHRKLQERLDAERREINTHMLIAFGFLLGTLEVASHWLR
jgi:hypothetical protein